MFMASLPILGGAGALLFGSCMILASVGSLVVIPAATQVNAR
jgi:Mn2+/Fe2+ NRAMP family transporter